MTEQASARRSWLDDAERVWRDDSSVVAAWLWGSEWRGTADALSDFDLFVILSDNAAFDDFAARFADVGEVLWAREVPYNAPKAGRYFTVGYPGPVLPVVVDWYWQPAAHAVIGDDTRILFEKAPIARATVPTFELFPNVRDAVPYHQPDDPKVRLEGQLVWFWFMLGPLSKSAARGKLDTLAEHIPLLDAVLAMASAHVHLDQPPVPGDDAVSTVRVLADRMTALDSLLAAEGIAIPEGERQRGLEALTVAEALIADGWTSRVESGVTSERPGQTHPLTLPTDRPDVTLRELTINDVDAYYALVDRNRVHLNQHGNYPFEHDADLDAIRSYFENPWDTNTRLGIWSHDQLIGRIDLNPVDRPKWVLGYWIDSAFTGRGFVTSACRAVIGHARALDATEIYAGVTNGNEPSIRVLRRLGFEHIQDIEDRSRWRLALVQDPPPPVMA